MQKKILFILLIAIFAFSGCGQKEGDNNQAEKQQKMAQKEKKMSLSEWLKAGKGTKCTLTAPEGDMVVYSQGDKVRIEGVPYMFSRNMGDGEPQIGVQLSDDEWMYTWSGKEGTKMNIKEIEEAADGMEEEEQETPEGWDEMIGEMEEAGIDYECEDLKLADSLFELPADVEFNDLTPMMTGMADWGNSIQEKMENGAGMEELDMQEMQKMMEQMQQ